MYAYIREELIKYEKLFYSYETEIQQHPVIKATPKS